MVGGATRALKLEAATGRFAFLAVAPPDIHSDQTSTIHTI